MLLEPLRGISPTQTFDNNFVLDLSTVFAMIVYALLGMLLIAVVSALNPVAEAVSKNSKKK